MAPDDLRWARLIQRIQQAHCWVISPSIDAAYRRQFGQIACRGSVTSGLMTSLNLVQLDQNRSLNIVEPPQVEGDYDTDDRHVVSAASEAPDSILITVDERLVKDLERSTIPDDHGFMMCLLDAAEEALL